MDGIVTQVRHEDPLEAGVEHIAVGMRSILSIGHVILHRYTSNTSDSSSSACSSSCVASSDHTARL